MVIKWAVWMINCMMTLESSNYLEQHHSSPCLNLWKDVNVFWRNPGSNPEAFVAIKPIFQAICAKIREDSFCDWEGEGNSGHLVKMVNNSIEYGDMQLMQKAYDLMQV